MAAENHVIITCNAGSSTIKFSLYEVSGQEPERLAAGLIDYGHTPWQVHIHAATGETLLDEMLPEQTPAQLFRWIIDKLTSLFSHSKLVAAGHRIVHGGKDFTHPVLINANHLAALSALSPLAPLHQPHNLAAIEAFANAAPGLPQVACFDTSFHHDNAKVASQYALPRQLTEEGIQRYGFHGLSYEYIADQLPAYAGEAAQGKVIVAHLGSGASLCAIQGGHSVATTMGFSALDGLPMAERCGELDPGVLLYLMQEKGMDYQALSQLLYKQSGLLGVSGISGDMRILESDGSAEAQEAINLFTYRISRQIGSLAAALGGLDVLVFTGGIGEHSALVRAAVCRRAAWLGIVLDEEANRVAGNRLHLPASRVGVYRIPCDENQVIARATKGILDET